MCYERFKLLCDLNGIKPVEVSRGTGIYTSTLSSWKKGKYTPKDDKLQLIADFFHVPLAFIQCKDDFITCPICSMSYSPLSGVDVEEHRKFHDKYEKAIAVYGDIPVESTVREKRDYLIAFFRDNEKGYPERIEAYEEFLRYDFLLDVIESGYSTELDKMKHDYREISTLRPSYATPLNFINYIRKNHDLPVIEDGYYDDQEVARLAQEIYDDPDMRFLFLAKQKMSAERFKRQLDNFKDAYKLENPDDEFGC